MQSARQEKQTSNTYATFKTAVQSVMDFSLMQSNVGNIIKITTSTEVIYVENGVWKACLGLYAVSLSINLCVFVCLIVLAMLPFDPHHTDWLPITNESDNEERDVVNHCATSTAWGLQGFIAVLIGLSILINGAADALFLNLSPAVAVFQ